MPEITDAQLTEYHQYKAIAPTPAEVTRKIDDTVKDNGRQRDEIRDLKEKVKAIPAEGAVVIPPGDEATAYAAWKALEMKPEDVAKVKKERDDLAAKDAQRTRQDLLTAARETEGWNENAPKALLKLAGFDALELTAGEVTVEKVNAGKKENVKAPTAFVTVDGKPVRISEWLAKEAPEFVPLLTAQGSGNGGGGSPGIVVQEQRGHTGSPGTKTDDDFRKATAGTAQYDTF